LTTLNLTGKDATSVAADALVLATAASAGGGSVSVLGADALPTGVRRAVERLLPALGVKGKADEVVRVPSPDGVKATVLVLTGTGAPGRSGTVDDEALRRAAGAAVRSLAGRDHVVLALPTDTPSRLAAVAEGALLGAYAYTEYRRRSADPSQEPVARLSLVTGSHRDKAAKAVVERAHVLADAVAGTKDLVNCPPLDLYPARFAEIAQALGKEHGVAVKVLDEAALRKGGYGGLVGVGQGSPRGPRLVKVSYTPSGRARGRKHLALVGKGITFDSGGLSIKPAAGMETMKLDMAGAAAVMHTVVAASRLRLPVAVTAWLCLAENMPSGTAQRPSDVITVYGGRTVEVLNTDAEGRLVLADGIVAACEEDPDVLVDVATLTGAQMVALGNRVSAVMANDDDLRAQVTSAADDSGEQLWPMPLPAELRASMDSAVADIANIGDRFGGMLVAGLFLSEFVGTRADGTPVPWAHVDIAGPSFNSGAPHGYTGKGGTGVAVRTLLTLAERMA
jgi:leucyl aminopeptidase